MEVTCGSCNKKITIPAEKIPKNASFSFNCPSCKNKITVQPPKGGALPSGPSGETFTLDSEIKGAMVCHTKPEGFKKLLEDMGYGVHIASQHITALNNLRFNDYRVIIVTREFEELTHDGPSILETLQSMQMQSRRYIYLVYVTPGVRSFDLMQAYSQSLNMLVSSDDAGKDNFKAMLERGIKENDAFFKVIKETLAAQGRV